MTKIKIQLPALLLRHMTMLFTALLLLLQAQFAQAQPPADPGNGPPRGPMVMEPDPRVEQRTYHFEDTSEELGYVLYVSSKVSKDKPNPLIIALHGYGGDGNFLLRNQLVDLAEEQGYIVAAPLGYNVTGWYGSPVIVIGGGAVEPANLPELSEKDVMNVLGMLREEFNVDPQRTYLMGHSMGGAGALFLGQKHTDIWAALVSIAPAAFMMQPTQDEYLAPVHAAGIPVMVIQGDKDTVVPPENTRTWIDTMKELGMKHEYIEFKEGDHGTIIGDGMADIFRFFADNPKKS